MRRRSLPRGKPGSRGPPEPWARRTCRCRRDSEPVRGGSKRIALSGIVPC